MADRPWVHGKQQGSDQSGSGETPSTQGQGDENGGQQAGDESGQTQHPFFEFVGCKVFGGRPGGVGGL